MPILNHFVPDATRQAVLKDCIDNYGVGDDRAEWPNNILSRHAVVYENGTIARADDAITFAVDSEELDLCIRLANEVATIMDGEEVGMGSESSEGFSAFWICANVDENPSRIDEDLIQARFGYTIFPPATIEIGPLSQEEDIFGSVRQGLAEMIDDDPENTPHYQTSLEKWENLVRWFGSRKEFQHTAWVAIGDESELRKVAKEDYPPGTEMTPCVLPRLLLGLTQNGSLCGLSGFVVYT